MPLPSMHYEYMERRTAKVSGDFHVRFDNAYYSVDKAFLHKSVMIAASATKVNIYSMKGDLIVSWRRASRRGEWLTDPSHLPDGRCESLIIKFSNHPFSSLQADAYKSLDLPQIICFPNLQEVFCLDSPIRNTDC